MGGAIAGIVVTHGNLAEALIRTAEVIVGKQEDVSAIAGADLNDEEIIKRIREIVTGRPDGRALVFVDFFGGSCCTNSQRAAVGSPGVRIISGVNLPMLLDFATKRRTMGFDEMVEHLIRRGRESIKLVVL